MNKSIWAKITNAAGQVFGNFVTGTKKGDKHLLDVSVQELIGEVSGTFTPSGLQNEGKYTSVTINDTSWAPVPPTGQVGRNQINIQNFTGYEVKINHTGSGAYANNGMRIPDQNERFYQIAEGIVIYARAESGSGSIVIDVEELS